MLSFTYLLPAKEYVPVQQTDQVDNSLAGRVFLLLIKTRMHVIDK
jgi:hypothetical protein